MKERRGLLPAIAAFKLVKATILIAVAIGAFKLIGGEDTAERVRHWSRALHMHGRWVDEGVAKIGGFDASDLAKIGVGTIVYAAVFLTEGIGLLTRRVWAEYLTLLVTASFIPFEVYEAMQSGTPTRIITIIINALVVVYLVLRLKRDHHWPFRAKPEATTAQPAHP